MVGTLSIMAINGKTSLAVVYCTVCLRKFEFFVDTIGIKEWQAGKHIQYALPQLLPGQRELLISRMCSECYDQMLGGGEDDEN